MHLPVRFEELFDGLFGEEVRRPVGAVQHFDFPLLRVVRNHRLGGRGRLMVRHRGRAAGQLRLADRQHVALAQGTAAVAAELAKHEGSLAAQVVGHVDAVAHRDIGAAAAGRLAGGERLAGFHRHRLPHGYRLAVQGGVAGGAGERHHGVAVEFQRWAHQRGLQAGGAGVVADNAVAEPEGVVIHRPGGRHADVPVAGAAGVVLHRGVGARLHHFEGGGGVLETFQVAGGDLACHHVRVDQNAAQVIQVGGDAGQARGGQGVLHFFQRRRAVVAVHDHLGEHRVVVRAHLGAGVHPAVQADVVRE